MRHLLPVARLASLLPLVALTGCFGLFDTSDDYYPSYGPNVTAEQIQAQREYREQEKTPEGRIAHAREAIAENERNIPIYRQERDNFRRQLDVANRELERLRPHRDRSHADADAFDAVRKARLNANNGANSRESLIRSSENNIARARAQIEEDTALIQRRANAKPNPGKYGRAVAQESARRGGSPPSRTPVGGAAVAPPAHIHH